MDTLKEKFLKNEFLTMAILGALGRSKTYSKSASKQNKRRFLNALREKLREIGDKYISNISEEEHLLNINKIADDLTSSYPLCLKNRRFRIGVAQKALNLYLKYLWCAGFIPEPPHCPFDLIVIRHLQNFNDLKWTSIDTIVDYKRLVRSARAMSADRSISAWELEIWLKNVQSKRERKIFNRLGDEWEQRLPLMGTSQPNLLRYEGGVMIDGSVTSQGVYADGRDICELYISTESSNMLPHEYGQKIFINIRIGDFIYEAGLHETSRGIVWMSSVLYKEPERDKTRLVDALANIDVKKGDKIRIESNEEGIFSLRKME